MLKGQALELQANTPTDRNNHLIFTSRPDTNLWISASVLIKPRFQDRIPLSSMSSNPSSSCQIRTNLARWLSCNHSFLRTAFEADSTSQDDLVPKTAEKMPLLDPWFCSKAFWLQYSLSFSCCDISPLSFPWCREIDIKRWCWRRKEQQVDLGVTHPWMCEVYPRTDSRPEMMRWVRDGRERQENYLSVGQLILCVRSLVIALTWSASWWI